MSMQISERTKNLLGNFAQINNSIYIKPGSKISTIAVTKNVFATAEVNEQFPEAFAIYDLGQFLNGWNLFADSSQVDFQFNNESFLTIKSGRSKLKYFYCDPDVLILPPDKELGLPETQFSFQLNEDVLVSLLKASRVLYLPDLCLECKGGDVTLAVKDKDNETSNTVSYVVGKSDVPFCFNFKMETIKIIPGDYNVDVCTRAAKFNRITDPKDLLKRLEYFIALEPDSTYGN
tara:strand:- start:2514 stop:3212 length:699 start_codon:yes stop_codon:yes gene_type:complete